MITSSATLYSILAAIMFVLWIICLFTRLCFPRIKQFSKLSIILILSCIITIRFGVANPVYLIQDEKYVLKYHLLFPARIQLKNGDLHFLKPIFGLNNAWIINDDPNIGFFEMLPYGKEKEGYYRLTINPYTIHHVPKLDYYFEPPPSQLKSFTLSTHKSWFYR